MRQLAPNKMGTVEVEEEVEVDPMVVEKILTQNKWK